MRLIIAAVLVSTSSTVASAQTPVAPKPTTQPPRPTTAATAGCLPAPAVLRKRALALTKVHSDIPTILRALDKEVGANTALVEQGPGIAIHYEEGLLVSLFYPYSSYRFALGEAIRQRESIATVDIPTVVSIHVSPSQIDAPDIVRVIVERNGKVVAPIANTLRPTVFTTRLGAKSLLHSGALTFSCTAFAPGGRVMVTAIPESGDNFEKVFSQTELASITGRRVTAAFAETSEDLIGMLANDVLAGLREPDEKENIAQWNRWVYLNADGGVALYLYFEGDKVQSTRPLIYELKPLKKQ